MQLVFSMLHKLLICLHKLGLFSMYKISDLEKCVHYTVELGLHWESILKALGSIYRKIDNASKWKTEEEFISLLDPIERKMYECGTPESTYIRTLVYTLSIRRKHGDE